MASDEVSTRVDRLQERRERVLELLAGYRKTLARLRGEHLKLFTDGKEREAAGVARKLAALEDDIRAAEALLAEIEAEQAPLVHRMNQRASRRIEIKQVRARVERLTRLLRILELMGQVKNELDAISPSSTLQFGSSSVARLAQLVRGPWNPTGGGMAWQLPRELAAAQRRLELLEAEEADDRQLVEGAAG